jgi:hypothetical protein
MTMYGSQTILESSQAPPPNNCLRSVHCHYRSLYLIYYNLRLTDLQWCQCTLPIRFGGLGIRRISDICLPAFLSSVYGVKKLVSQLLNSKDNELIFTIMMKL